LIFIDIHTKLLLFASEISKDSERIQHAFSKGAARGQQAVAPTAPPLSKKKCETKKHEYKKTGTILA